MIVIIILSILLLGGSIIASIFLDKKNKSNTAQTKEKRNNQNEVSEMDNTSQQNTASNSDSYVVVKLSKIYKAIAIILLIAGLIGGIALGDIYKATKITYKYPSIQEGITTEEVYNVALAITVCVGAILLYAIFRGISIIMHNQETIIEKMDGKENTVEATKDQSEDEKRTD